MTTLLNRSEGEVTTGWHEDLSHKDKSSDKHDKLPNGERSGVTSNEKGGSHE